MHIVDPPLAPDHDRQPGRKGRFFVQGAVHFMAVAAVEQFEIAVDRIRDARGLGRPRIGGIGVAEAAFAAFGPDRPGYRGDESAQYFGFAQQGLMPQVQFGEFPAQSAQRTNPDNGLAADGAAHGLDGMSGGCRQIEQKTLPGVAQGVDRMIDLQRRFRRQPGTECKDALRPMLLGFLRHQQRRVAADLRAIIARCP